MLLSLESRLSSAPSLFPVRGPRERSTSGQGRIGRPGSENMSKRESGFPRNLGDPVVSTEAFPDGDTGRPTPGPPPTTRHGGGSETDAFPWYRQAKETKCGGKDGRKSQCLDSTDEAGEQSPERTPGREARHRDHGLVVETYAEYLEIR